MQPVLLIPSWERVLQQVLLLVQVWLRVWAVRPEQQSPEESRVYWPAQSLSLAFWSPQPRLFLSSEVASAQAKSDSKTQLIRHFQLAGLLQHWQKVWTQRVSVQQAFFELE